MAQSTNKLQCLTLSFRFSFSVLLTSSIIITKGFTQDEIKQTKRRIPPCNAFYSQFFLLILIIVNQNKSLNFFHASFSRKPTGKGNRKQLNEKKKSRFYNALPTDKEEKPLSQKQ